MANLPFTGSQTSGGCGHRSNRCKFDQAETNWTSSTNLDQCPALNVMSRSFFEPEIIPRHTDLQWMHVS